MNKDEKNLPLNKLLQDYCKVNPPYRFTVELEETNMKSRNTKIITAVACAALALVCAVVFAAGFGNGIIPAVNPEDFGFIINARAESATNDSAEVLSFENKKVNKDNPLIYPDTEHDFILCFEHLALEIIGEDVVSYSAKAEKGQLHFFDNEYRLSENNVINGTEIYDYFISGRELLDLPSDPGETYLFWLPDPEIVRADTSSDRRFRDCLQSAEDYNKYFADTVTLTVKYQDGSQKAVDIHISFDSEGYVYAGLSENSNDLKIY